MVTAVLVIKASWIHTSSLLSLTCVTDAYYLYRRYYSLCTLCTPRAFTRPMFTWRALFVSPMMQLVQSPPASSPYSTRVVLARTTCAIDVTVLYSSHASSLYSTPVLLARTTCTADNAAYAISKPLIDACAPGTHFLHCRCCSLKLQLVDSPHASGLYSTRVSWQA